MNARYEQIRAAMTPDAPIASAVNLDQLLATTMYDGQLFPIAAEVLADLGTFLAAQRAGDVHAMRTASSAVRAAYPLPLRTSARRPLSSDAEDAAFYAVTCNDTPWADSRNTLAEQSQTSGESYPLIGWSTISASAIARCVASRSIIFGRDQAWYFGAVMPAASSASVRQLIAS